MELQNVFTTILNMTITGSIVIGCVILARLALGKAPRVFACALWLVVLFRLLSPVSVSAPVSVLRMVDAPELKSGVGTVAYLELPVRAPTEMIVPAGTGETAQTTPVQTKPPTDWNLIGTWVWLVGVCALTGYGTISYVNLKRRLRESVPVGDGIRETDGIGSPFVLGLLRPTIYLPSGLGTGERGYMLLHEQTHIRHGDPIVKAVFWLAVCIHWFNPLVWLAFRLCGRDMELRCDETVLKSLGTQVRSDYAQSLLNCAAGRQFAPAPLAFGEGDTGRRVKYVLSWKRKAAWMAVPAAVLCAVVLVMTACNPGGSQDTPFGHSYRVSAVISRKELPQETPELFTLTSDTALIVRQDGQTVMYGALKKVAAGTPLPVTMPEGTHTMLSPVENAWKTDDDGWWLFQKEDGELGLWREGEYLLKLERTDLLGVSIKQPGIEAYVEPVWYSTDSWDWMPGDMSTTLVDSDAKLVLMPEQDVDMIEVREEYYMRTDGETSITNTEHILKPDKNGDFLLDVSRQGTHGDDFAVYWVTVGDDRYVFRLSFPAVPGETSVAIGVPEQTREVRYSEGSAWITLQLPERWAYHITYLDDPEIDAGISAGITFWPQGREEGKLFFGYYPDLFAVCGTGLETDEMMLAGQKATVGTYDDRALWDFICFGEYFAVWGQGHEAWWAEYGGQAMEILNAAKFDCMP